MGPPRTKSNNQKHTTTVISARWTITHDDQPQRDHKSECVRAMEEANLVNTSDTSKSHKDLWSSSSSKDMMRGKLHER